MTALVIDTDVALGVHHEGRPRDIDDGFAMVEAINAPDLDLLGITTVYGNAPHEAVRRVARKIVALKKSNTPVTAGAIEPLPQSGDLPAREQPFESTERDVEPDDVEEALAAWAAAVAQQRALVQDLADDEVRQLLEVTRLRGLVTAPTGSQQERNLAMVEVGVADSRLTDIRTELDEARIELQRLEADSPGEL